MNIIKTINFIVLFALCITISNNINAIARYKARPLEALMSNTLNNGELGFRYKLFNKKDCKTYLDRRRIKRKGYTPVQVSIANNTNKSLQFSLNDMSLPYVSYNQVAHDVQFVNTAKKVAAWLIPCLWIPLLLAGAWPLWLISTLGNNNTLEWEIFGLFAGGVGVLATATTAPPAIAEGIKVPKAQKQLLTDYESKALHDTIIKPFETINGIVFVQTKELTDSFSLTLVDTTSHKTYLLSTDSPSITIRSQHAFFPVFKNLFKFI